MSFLVREIADLNHLSSLLCDTFGIVSLKPIVNLRENPKCARNQFLMFTISYVH